MTRCLHTALLSLALLALPGPATPGAASAADRDSVLVVDVTQAAPEEHLLAACLQGIANGGADVPIVFLFTRSRDGDWLDYCQRFGPRAVRPVTSRQLLDVLKPEVSGQILYDRGQPYLLNVATTAAGVHRAVVSPSDLGLPTLLDLRGRWSSAAEAERWAIEALLPQCSRTKLALLPPHALALRDYVVRERIFALSIPEPGGEEILDHVLFRLAPGAAVFGEASAGVRTSLSRASHFLVGGSQAANLSFFSRIDTGLPFHQYMGYIGPSAPRFLALIFDCSDLDLAINHMPSLWEHPARGSLPLGWAIPAAIAEVAPPVAHRYYTEAYLGGTDQFLLGETGAGGIDLALATAPYTYFRATAAAHTALDTTATLYASAGQDASGSDLIRFAADTGTRGAFVVDAPEMAPLLLDGIPVLAAPRVLSAADAIDRLNRIPLDRRCVALTLDARMLTPADAAHIAAHVSNRFAVIPPGEMIELMRDLSVADSVGGASLEIRSVKYPDSAQPDAPTPVAALIDGPQPLLSASVVYRRAGHSLFFAEPMVPVAEGVAAMVPPLRPGGSIEISIRARDVTGRTVWSPPWTLEIPRIDNDSDGLSAAEERYLLANDSNPDTDGDGLTDGVDPRPVRADRCPSVYLGPIRPPSDLPYLLEAGESTVCPEGRLLAPGDACLYRLPCDLLPPGAPAVVALDARGPVRLLIATGSDPVAQEFAGSLDARWYSNVLPEGAATAGVFVRVESPEEAVEDLLVRAISVVSPPEAPSIDRITWSPSHPGPLQAVTVSAVIFGPHGVEGADLTYRINDRGTITIPMASFSGAHRYQARVPALGNRDRLEWWLTARDPEGRVAVSVPRFLTIGGRAREVVPLVATRDFVGDWSWGPQWDGAARVAASAGLRDSAHINLTGATYRVWVLAGGRGQGIDVYVKDRRVGSIDCRLPDGWQQVGRIPLDAGRHEVHLVSQSRPGAPTGASPRYASVIFSADSTFSPPANRVFDMHNSIALLSPRAGDTLSGHVTLLATGAGNLTAAEFSLDDELLERVSGPPFRFLVNTPRLPRGEHRLRVEAVDRAGPTGLVFEIPVTIAN